MNFQSLLVNIVAKFSEGRFFNVFVITGTVHYPSLDYIKRATFDPNAKRNVWNVFLLEFHSFFSLFHVV